MENYYYLCTNLQDSIMKEETLKAAELLEKNVKKIVEEHHSSLAQLAKAMGIMVITEVIRIEELKPSPKMEKTVSLYWKGSPKRSASNTGVKSTSPQIRATT